MKCQLLSMTWLLHTLTHSCYGSYTQPYKIKAVKIQPGCVEGPFAPPSVEELLLMSHATVNGLSAPDYGYD